jgi:CDP-glycerol glycerophosphotransferase (TagB/SpsB family)
MANTPLQKRVWKNEISAALAKSKLLITDYSSVCYNSFYQGGGVVFFQPDLNYYEEVNGKLIPNDEEYIGYRAFDLETLDKILSGGLSEQKVDLSYFRTQEFIERYLRINSFTDGKNLERILKSLQKIHVV